MCVSKMDICNDVLDQIMTVKGCEHINELIGPNCQQPGFSKESTAIKLVDRHGKANGLYFQCNKCEMGFYKDESRLNCLSCG